MPEDIGEEVAHRLIDEIYRGGCVDSTAQSLVALWMALGPKDISKFITGITYLYYILVTYINVIFLGPISEYTIGFLRHLRDFFGITFKVSNPQQDEEDEDDTGYGSNKVLLTCVGIGYTNINKRVT